MWPNIKQPLDFFLRTIRFYSIDGICQPIGVKYQILFVFFVQIETCDGFDDITRCSSCHLTSRSEKNSPCIVAPTFSVGENCCAVTAVDGLHRVRRWLWPTAVGKQYNAQQLPGSAGVVE